jgi:hypothetical protein
MKFALISHGRIVRFGITVFAVLFVGSAVADNNGLDATRLKLGHFKYRTLLDGKDAGEDEITVHKNPLSGIFELSDQIEGTFAQQWSATTTTQFKPVAAKLAFGSGNARRTAFEFIYKDGRAMGTTTPRTQTAQSQAIPFDVPVPDDTVDQRIDWASVMSLDLKAGGRFEYHVFDPGTGVSRISVNISGPETLQVPAGTYQAMRIVYRIENANGTEVYKVLTNRDGPRMLLREEFQNGAVTELLSIRE